MNPPLLLAAWSAEALWLAVQVILLAWSLMGWGYSCFRLLNPDRESGAAGGPNPFEYGVPGIALVVVLGGFATLFTALSDALGTAMLVGGWAGYAFLVRTLRQTPARLALQFTLALVLGLFFASGSAFTGVHYDTGLYHLQQVLWYQAEPLPFGLANLLGHFGYVSAWLLFSAAVSANSLLPDLLFLVNPTLSVIVSGALLQLGLERIRAGRMSFGPLLSLAAVALLVFAARPTFFSWMGASPSTDIPAMWITIYALARFAAFLEDGEPLAALSAESSWALFACFTASSLAVAVKLSQFPAALMVAAGSLWLLRRASWRSWRNLLIPAGGAACVGAVWVVHGLLSSGCFAYPAGPSCVGWLPWSVDRVELERFAWVFQTWARAPGYPKPEEITAWNWFPHWLELLYPHRETLPDVGMAFVILLAAALVWRIAARRRGGSGNAAGLPWCVGASLLGVIVVTLQAPDPRYCLGFVVALPAALLAWLFLKPAANLSGRGRTALLLTAAAVIAGFGIKELRRTLPKPDEERQCCTWRDFPEVEARTVQTEGGATVLQPVKGDQCWDLPGPCTPHPNDHLQETRYLGHRAFIRTQPAGSPGQGETAPP